MRRADRPGAGRVLALTYAFFVLAAGARSGVQLATEYHRAPLAYLLSALAAAVYLAGAVVMIAAERTAVGRRWAWRLCVTELAGVILIGSTSLVLPRWFPDATVWSGYGSGYGYLPLALPVLAMTWLARSTSLVSAERGQTRRPS